MPTAQTGALRLLRYYGVTSLDSTTPARQPFEIQPTDLDDVLSVMNYALQVMRRREPGEEKQQNLGAYLHAPTTVSFTVTNGNAAISSFSGYQPWMAGCTVRVNGDSQDNELTSATLMARPFVGTSGTTSAIVYGDAVQLDETISDVCVPVSLPNQAPLIACTDRMTFMRLSGYPMICNPSGSAYGYPFFWFVQKVVSRPLAWFLEGAYQAGTNYVPRRIRVAPMPDQNYSLAFRANINPTRLQLTDLQNEDFSDPGILIPVPDDQFESLFEPIALKQLSGKPPFKNSDCLPQIEAAYLQAIATLKSLNPMQAPTRGIYI